MAVAGVLIHWSAPRTGSLLLHLMVAPSPHNTLVTKLKTALRESPTPSARALTCGRHELALGLAGQLVHRKQGWTLRYPFDAILN